MNSTFRNISDSFSNGYTLFQNAIFENSSEKNQNIISRFAQVAQLSIAFEFLDKFFKAALPTWSIPSERVRLFCYVTPVVVKYASELPIKRPLLNRSIKVIDKLSDEIGHLSRGIVFASALFFLITKRSWENSIVIFFIGIELLHRKKIINLANPKFSRCLPVLVHFFSIAGIVSAIFSKNVLFRTTGYISLVEKIIVTVLPIIWPLKADKPVESQENLLQRLERHEHSQKCEKESLLAVPKVTLNMQHLTMSRSIPSYFTFINPIKSVKDFNAQISNWLTSNFPKVPERNEIQAFQIDSRIRFLADLKIDIYSRYNHILKGFHVLSKTPEPFEALLFPSEALTECSEKLISFSDRDFQQIDAISSINEAAQKKKANIFTSFDNNKVVSLNSYRNSNIRNIKSNILQLLVLENVYNYRLKEINERLSLDQTNSLLSVLSDFDSEETPYLERLKKHWETFCNQWKEFQNVSNNLRDREETTVELSVLGHFQTERNNYAIKMLKPLTLFHPASMENSIVSLAIGESLGLQKTNERQTRQFFGEAALRFYEMAGSLVARNAEFEPIDVLFNFACAIEAESIPLDSIRNWYIKWCDRQGYNAAEKESVLTLLSEGNKKFKEIRQNSVTYYQQVLSFTKADLGKLYQRMFLEMGIFKIDTSPKSSNS